MLVLSRRSGQRVVIAGEITVTVLEVRGDRIKLGFEAPPTVPIHRDEIRRQIEAAPLPAAPPAPTAPAECG